MTDLFADPIGLSRDPYWDDAWTDRYTNEYVLPHPDNEFEELRAGRASELGKTISNTFTLNRWHKEMVLRGVLIRKSILLKAADALNGSGLSAKEAKRVLWELCKEAEDVAGAKEPAALGTGFHALTERWDARTITLNDIPEPWDRDMLAYAEVLMRAGIVAVPALTERIVWNRPLNTAGRLDRLWRYLRHCDKWHVGDLKTGRFIEHGWGENPIQLQCYAGATHMFHPPTRAPRPEPSDSYPNLITAERAKYLAGNAHWTAMPETCQEVGLILHVPSDGKKYAEGDIMANGQEAEGGEPTGTRMAALYEVDLTTEIEPVTTAIGNLTITPAELAKAVQQWHKASRKVARVVARVEVTEHGEVIDSPLSISEQIDLAGSEAEIEELRAACKARKEWKGHHTIRARERVAALSA